MLFNSLAYLIFLPLVFFLHFTVPFRYRWMVLLAASCFFYMYWKYEYIILIFISSGIDYYAAYRMGLVEDQKIRKRYLYLSMISNLSILFLFKYYNFFSGEAAKFADAAGYNFDPIVNSLILPMGISFYTFQAMSYTIDVYFKRIPPERHFGFFGLYIMFFPQLVAGPIERAGHLLGQLKKRTFIHAHNLRYGFLRILWGLFKKCVVADNLAYMVDYVYDKPEGQSGLVLVMATIFFAFQIYCDFSGYSDIAIGTARLFGIKLMENFRIPYLSRDIPEFWQRWHISLSTWFRDYLYIPLGGNRVVKWRWYYNLFITFLISGLWHGANWTYIVWGALHGLALVITYLVYGPKRKAKNDTGWSWLKVPFTFTLVCISWVFFRSDTIDQSFQILQKIAAVPDFSLKEQIRTNTLYLGEPLWRFLGYILLLTAFIISEYFFHMKRAALKIVFGPRLTRWSLYYALIFLTLCLGVFGRKEFIYFQF